MTHVKSMCRRIATRTSSRCWRCCTSRKVREEGVYLMAPWGAGGGRLCCGARLRGGEGAGRVAHGRQGSAQALQKHECVFLRTGCDLGPSLDVLSDAPEMRKEVQQVGRTPADHVFRCRTGCRTFPAPRAAIVCPSPPFRSFVSPCQLAALAQSNRLSYRLLQAHAEGKYHGARSRPGPPTPRPPPAPPPGPLSAGRRHGRRPSPPPRPLRRCCTGRWLRWPPSRAWRQSRT